MRGATTGVGLLWVLTSCGPPCSGRAYLRMELWSDVPLQAAYQEQLYLYVTTTRTDLDVSVLDRAALDWNGKGGWEIGSYEHYAAAPSLPDCRDAFEPERYYPYSIRVELGDVDGRVIDSEIYPTVVFEPVLDEERVWSRALWSGLQLSGRLGPSVGAPNTPVDTATW